MKITPELSREYKEIRSKETQTVQLSSGISQADDIHEVHLTGISILSEIRVRYLEETAIFIIDVSMTTYPILYLQEDSFSRAGCIIE